MLQKARNLRKNQTDVEKLLWSHLRNRHLDGYKFRRQFPIGRYIVDFVCNSKDLVVEVDGGQHAELTTKDEVRTEFLNKEGYKVVRFWNNDVLAQHRNVIDYLTLALAQREGELGNKDVY